jgi:hypothetical protein
MALRRLRRILREPTLTPTRIPRIPRSPQIRPPPRLARRRPRRRAVPARQLPGLRRRGRVRERRVRLAHARRALLRDRRERLARLVPVRRAPRGVLRAHGHRRRRRADVPVPRVLPDAVALRLVQGVPRGGGGGGGGVAAAGHGHGRVVVGRAVAALRGS